MASIIGIVDTFFDKSDYIYPVFLALAIVLALVDVITLLAGFGRLIKSSLASTLSAVSGSVQQAPAEEVCPTCLEKLVDGECPHGHTIVRCSKCNTIMKDGLCPRCGVQGETEFCPTCNSELVDGECPRGHTIVRCPDCGAILNEGICPRGCNADPLNLGWPGGTARSLCAFALKVASPEKFGGFTLGIPSSFIVGRSASEAKEPFVELLTISKKEKAQCSRQYIRMDMQVDGESFKVTLLNSSRNPAFVNGEKLELKDQSAIVKLGGKIKLNPGYELELVKGEAKELARPELPSAAEKDSAASETAAESADKAADSSDLDYTQTIRK